MLFYSYQVGEDRFYQEVESIDELYKIVEQCLEEYNQTHKTQMNLVIFRYRPSFLIWNVSVLYDTNDVSTVLCYLLNGFQCCMFMYRKIPRGLYFSKAFLRGLYSEGLIYGGKFAFQNRLGKPVIVGRKFTGFALFYFVFEGNFQVQANGLETKI